LCFREKFMTLQVSTFATQSGVKQTCRYRPNDAFDPQQT
jgi:hypothetical protein